MAVSPATGAFYGWRQHFFFIPGDDDVECFVIGRWLGVEVPLRAHAFCGRLLRYLALAEHPHLRVLTRLGSLEAALQ